MEITLSSRQLDELAYKIALILDKRQKEHRKEQRPEMVCTNDAAKLLGITPGRLRHIVCEDPTRYPHIKRGDSSRSRLLFLRSGLGIK